MKKITFCGGGSAGHVIPNIALIEDLSKDYEISYLGTHGIEEEICKKCGVPFYAYDGVKLVRGKILCNISIPVKLIKAHAQCKRILGEIKPDLLFCKGGYVCLPAAYAAASCGIPVLTHESDLSAGLTTKLISRKCERTLTAFPETAGKFKNGVYTGTPMRKSLFSRSKTEAKERLNLDMRPTVLVFGGGSGSAKINGALRENLKKLCAQYNILHLCGKGNKVDCGIAGYKQLEFSDDMGLCYAACDYAVARCGSNSANELISLKIPTLFIPLEGQSRGDQVENARYFQARGLCRVLNESELDAHSLYDGITALIADENLKAALDGCRIRRGNRDIEIEIGRAINQEVKR